jgi:hypothetical protein
MNRAVRDPSGFRGGFDLTTVAGCEQAMGAALSARDREAFCLASQQRARLLAGGHPATRQPAGRGIYGADLAGLANAIADAKRELARVDQQRVADVLNGTTAAPRRAKPVSLDEHFRDHLDRHFGDYED